MLPIAFILNARSGGGAALAAARRIEATLADAGRSCRVVLARDGHSIDSAARQAVESGCAALVAGGGDGTVNSVATAVAGTDIPFGVLPLGTLNHFARDLGISTELDAALAIVLGGATRQVDVGEVNGRLFVNNSSLGVYPRIVRLRERMRERGVGKWLGALWATLVVLRRSPFVGVRLTVDGEPIVRRTPFVFVGNNEYHMEGLQAGTRDTLTDGRLWIYVMNASGRRNLLWLAFQVWLGRAEQTQELESFCVSEAIVELRRAHVGVALDGEVRQMVPPLEYRVRPQALRVLVGSS
jgi:diacylglycerol kinase family enzyme